MLDNTKTEPDFDNLIQQLREAHRYIGEGNCGGNSLAHTSATVFTDLAAHTLRECAGNGPYSEEEEQLFNRISGELLCLLADWSQTFEQMADEADDEDTHIRWSRTAWRISKTWDMLRAAKDVIS